MGGGVLSIQDEILADAKQRMQKSLEAFDTALNRIRTNRAQPSLLDEVLVEYYGSEMPVSKVASVTVEDARTLLISPWEQPMLVEIERAILKSQLGLNPNVSSGVIRLIIPPLTEDGRKELIKQSSKKAEEAKVSVRNLRRSALTSAKSQLKDKVLTEDDMRGLETLIQQLTDRCIADIDKRLQSKEHDLAQI